MADPITDIVAKPMEALRSMAFKKIKFAMSKDLDNNIERLGNVFCSINAELQNADPFEASNDIERMNVERLQLIHEELTVFFSKLAARTGAQREVIGSPGFNVKVCSFLSSPKLPRVVLRFKFAAKVNNLTSKLTSLASDNELCKSLAIHSSGNHDRRTPSEGTSPSPNTNVLIGRYNDMENIINLLHKYSVVSIVGVGGQGKTTLAQYVCQDDRVKRSFDKLLWVFVTPKSSVDEILESIIISATGKKPTYYGLEQLHRQVFQAINGKKCLLVLDNVYYVNNLREVSKELNEILKHGGFWSNEGKVLITTRSMAVAKLMETPESYELHGLAEDDCWILLRHYAIKQDQEGKEESNVEEIGKDIAKLCLNVPLVLKIVGCQLAFKDYKSQWERFRNELTSIPIAYMSKQREKMKEILKHCYDQLDNNLKRCAAFCSLFPKGHKYCKYYMVRIWIALGFVESRDGMSLEDVGDAYVLELTQRGFFEEAGTFQFFKMHDVMHDLMRLIGTDKHQMIDSKTKNIVEGVRHISLNAQDLNWEVLLSSTSSKQKLESIILVSSAWDNRVHGEPLGAEIDKLIRASQKLKVLELFKQEIVEVPRSIGKLTLVRHLNLSHNPFCKLPDKITEMVNLLTLNLSWCHNLQELPREMGKLVNLLLLNLKECSKLEELPRGMGKLVKLRHLWVKGCKLRYMPEGFGNLTKLETLDVFVVGESSWSSSGPEANKGGAKLEELGHLNNLKGDLRIKVAGKSTEIVSETGEANFEKTMKLTGLEIVFEEKAEEDKKFLEGIQLCWETLEQLSIENYGGERLPVWMMDDQFHKRFPKLHSLFLSQTNKMNFHNALIFKDYVEFMRSTVQCNEDDLGELERYSKIKQLDMGTIELSFRARKRDGPRLTDVRDRTLQDVYFSIEKELGRCCSGLRQPRLRLKSCSPNRTKLELRGIPELEVLPEEFQGLFSIVSSLIIEDCPKLKAIPDWIDTFSSLKQLTIDNVPELKVLPDSICSLTSLVLISLWDCRGLKLLPHQISNLHCCLDIH